MAAMVQHGAVVECLEQHDYGGMSGHDVDSLGCDRGLIRRLLLTLIDAQ